MVVLAASIVTKGGKPLLSRQFLGLPRSRLESLLASFPRLVSPASEHTVLEAQGVRFVYTPLEDIYVLLITNTQSNILLDLSTLGLATRIVTELASGGRGGAIGELDVLRVSFEVLSAWDEVISQGWRENINLQQVRTVLEMESHEEKIQEIIARNKEHEAKEELKRRAKQLEIQRREMTKRGQNPYASGGSSGGFNPNNAGSYVPVQQQSYDSPARGGYGGQNDSPAPAAKPFKTKGMQLGIKGGKKNDGLEEALGGLNVDEPLMRQPTPRYDSEPEQSSHAPSPAPPVAQAPAKEANPFGDVPEADVHLILRETLSAEVNRDGGVQSLSLAGSLDLRISNPAYAASSIKLPPPSTYTAAAGSNELVFKSHPNVDKPAWTNSGLVKPRGAGFPVGRGLGVLKWRMTGKDESVLPLSVTCWPSSDNGTSTVNVEFELINSALALHNVNISIPLPEGASPSLSEAPALGECNLNQATGAFDWSLGEVSEAAGATTGSLEFECEGDDVGAFFPVTIEFVSQKGMVGVEIVGVETGGAATEFSVDSLFQAEEFTIV